jgi:hypothetical protein
METREKISGIKYVLKFDFAAIIDFRKKKKTQKA